MSKLLWFLVGVGIGACCAYGAAALEREQRERAVEARRVARQQRGEATLIMDDDVDAFMRARFGGDDDD